MCILSNTICNLHIVVLDVLSSKFRKECSHMNSILVYKNKDFTNFDQTVNRIYDYFKIYKAVFVTLQGIPNENQISINASLGKRITNKITRRIDIGKLLKYKPKAIYIMSIIDVLEAIQISQKMDIPMIVGFAGSEVENDLFEHKLVTNKKLQKAIVYLKNNCKLLVAHSTTIKKFLITRGFNRNEILVIPPCTYRHTEHYNFPDLQSRREITLLIQHASDINYYLLLYNELQELGHNIKINLLIPETLDKSNIVDGIEIEPIFYNSYLDMLDKVSKSNILCLRHKIHGEMLIAPHVIVEAHRLGVVVCSSRDAAIQEIIEHRITGMLSSYDAYDEMVNNVVSLLNNDLLYSNIRVYAAKNVNTQYNIELHALAMEHKIKQVIDYKTR